MMFLNLLAIHETPPKLPEFSGHVLLDTVIPRVSGGKGDIASNSSLKKTFYSDFYYAIQQHSSTLVPAFFSLTTFPSLLHLCGAILSSCSFNMFFRRLPSLTPLP
jgi:hypothetical protein